MKILYKSTPSFFFYIIGYFSLLEPLAGQLLESVRYVCRL